LGARERTQSRKKGTGIPIASTIKRVFASMIDRRSIVERLLLGALAGTLGLLIGCGARRSADDAGAINAFTPAPWPPQDVCTLLALADVQTVLPTAQRCGEDDPLSPVPGGPYWIVGSRWLGTPGVVSLTLVGAQTPEGKAGLDVSVPFDLDGGTALVPVTGVGTQAGYYDSSGTEQSLEVLFGSYKLTISVDGVTPDVPEAALQPLAVKAISAF
jgi:hypothetical protein